VDLDALARNFRAIEKSLPPGCRTMPVVKADAYGHGASPVSMRLQAEGTEIFAVAVVEEGLELRRAGIVKPILVMGWIGKDQLGDLVEGKLTPNIHSAEQLEELKIFCLREDKKVRAHLKLDTGMTRLGVRPEQLPEVLDILAKSEEHVFLEGVFQNFASADVPAAARTAAQTEPQTETQTEAQTGVFLEGVKAIRAAGHRPSMIHTDNSAAMLSRLINSPSKQVLFEITHVRPGLALYARVPGVPGLPGAPGLYEQENSLSDVMSFVSVIDQVKTVPPGTRVGYGGTFVCSRTTTLAIVPAGYADGVPRSLSGKGVVLVSGVRCLIAGRISMDLTAVDVTDLASPPRRGDDVVFFGTSGRERLGVEEVAEAAGTVSWELLCGVGPRVPRIIRTGGQDVARESKFL
jgi:alanine racemase